MPKDSDDEEDMEDEESDDNEKIPATQKKAEVQDEDDGSFS
jgi:hypothetical protein